MYFKKPPHDGLRLFRVISFWNGKNTIENRYLGF